MTSRTTALLLLAVSAAAIDTDFPGFVHFKNWAGGMGAQSTANDSSADRCLPKSTTSNVPHNILKDLCAADPKCTAFSFVFSNFGNADETTNTTYDMFLGIKGAENPAPAAFCTVKEGHGDYMNQKWLSCDNVFGYYKEVDIGDHHLVTYQPPLMPSAVIACRIQSAWDSASRTTGPPATSFKLVRRATGGLNYRPVMAPQAYSNITAYSRRIVVEFSELSAMCYALRHAMQL
jgi:hypothetical protein